MALPEGIDRLGPLIDQALIEREAGRCVASKIWIDGVELDAEALDALPARATAGVSRVEVKTRRVEEVAGAALESAADYAQKIEHRLREAADAYRAADAETAGMTLAECMDALIVILETVRGASPFLGSAGDLSRLEQEIAPALALLEDHQLRQDWLAVADVIEFEIAASLSRWPEELGRHRGGAPENH